MEKYEYTVEDEEVPGKSGEPPQHRTKLRPTLKPVDGPSDSAYDRYGFSGPKQYASREEAIQDSLNGLEKMMSKQSNPDPLLKNLQEAYIKDLGGIDAVNKLIADSKRPDFDISKLDRKTAQSLYDAATTSIIVEVGPNGTKIIGAKGESEEAVKKLVQDFNGGNEPEVDTAPKQDASDPMGTVQGFFSAMTPFAIGGIGDSQIPSAMEGTIAGPQAGMSPPSPGSPPPPGVNVTNTMRPKF